MFWEEKDLFVQTATRNEKPISQVAENMTVITAKDIEDMNVHTVVEVLNRVTGVFVESPGRGFRKHRLGIHTKPFTPDRYVKTYPCAA